MVQRAEGFAEGFDGEVVGFHWVVGHFQEHEIQGLTINLKKVGVCFFVAFFAGQTYQLVVSLRFVGG